MKVALVNHTRRSMEVHRVGCQDYLRDKKRGLLNGVTEEDIEGQDVATEIAAMLCEDFGDPTAWHASDIRVLPCVYKKENSK
jgi:hypothetical protein